MSLFLGPLVRQRMAGDAAQADEGLPAQPVIACGRRF